MIGTVGAGLAESERVDEEPLLLHDLPHRQHRSVESARRHVGTDFFRRPAVSRIVAVFDDFHEQTRRMPEADERLAEALLDAAVIDVVARQVIGPERQRTFRHRVGGRRDLSGAWPSRNPSVGERRQNRSDFRVGVRVIQMVVRVSAVEQDGLFDQPKAEHLREEVDVFLRAAGAERDVVDAANDRVRHASLRA